MHLSDLVTTSRDVGGVSGRLEKIERLATLLRRLAPDEIEIAVAFLSGTPRQGRIGLGGAAIAAARGVAPADAPALRLHDVDDAFGRIAAVQGRGSTGERARLLRDLLGRATAAEQDFLVRLLFGELRQGALEGVLVEAVARAADVPAPAIRRAAMMAGDLGPVAGAAMIEGLPALARFLVQVFRPVQPMLAETAETVDDALEQLPEAALEFKIDGARVQVHRAGDEVKVFSRNLREVTSAVPEIVELARALPAREVILDGEVIALRPDGTPHPFQATMSRFGRKLDIDRLRDAVPLSPLFFDVLHVDGTTLLDEPLSVRAGVLADVVPAGAVVPRLIGGTRAEARDFLDRALARGHEGIMAKALASPYAAGSRGASWLKIKPAHTLDLVVLAAEWGHGRRHGFLSNLHLGARDTERGGFVMLGKTFKGLTDATLAWQTARFLAIEIGRDAYTVYVRPELVVEIAFNDVQESPRYPGGLALRFARVIRYREDKASNEADTFERVQAIFRAATGTLPPPRR